MSTFGVTGGVATQQENNQILAFVDVSTASNSLSNTLSLSYPTGTSENDLLIAHICHQANSNQSPNTPTGWTQFSTLTDIGASYYTWWRRAPASPSGSVTFDGFSTGSGIAGFMGAWANGSTSQTITTTRDSGASPNSVSHSVGTADSMAICWGSADTAASETATCTIGGNGADERLDQWFSDATINLYLYDLIVAGTGATTYEINSTEATVNISTWATDWAP